jgi:hypothetical protein
LALIRLFDFALLAFLVWMVWSQVIRGWRAAAAAPDRRPDQSRAEGTEANRRHAAPPAAATSQENAAVTLVRCGACGVHVPSARMLPGPAGESFCSETCRSRSTARRNA